jgi:hypothetical protein
MDILNDFFSSLSPIKSLESFSSQEALLHFGRLIDLSLNTGEIQGLEQVINLSKDLEKRDLSNLQRALYHYFLSNAYANLSSLKKVQCPLSFEEEENLIEEQIINLQKALKKEYFKELPDGRKCQVLTNLAILTSSIGRFVEALEYLDKSLSINPSFAMSNGSKGCYLIEYAKALYDDGHSDVFIKHAHSYFKNALKNSTSSETNEDAEKVYETYINWIESQLQPDDLIIDMNLFSLGDSKEEIDYRQWCLNNRLFLNPLNDLGPYNIAARDIFTTPPIVLKIGKYPYYQAFYNQMKQEFVSARYLFYEGVTVKEPHFSDKEVLQVDTLDYPVYSLNAEKVKIAFRTTYSLFDKIAYFLKQYLNISIKESRVNFRSIWYQESSKDKKLKDKELRLEFKKSYNKPLMALFWLSKDLKWDGEKDNIFKHLIPYAPGLVDVRNHLEHKYFQLHYYGFEWPSLDYDSTNSGSTRLKSLNRGDFEEKTLEILKMSRAALIYLSLAVHFEEREKQKKRNEDEVIAPICMSLLDDNWKF